MFRKNAKEPFILVSFEFCSNLAQRDGRTRMKLVSSEFWGRVWGRTRTLNSYGNEFSFVFYGGCALSEPPRPGGGPGRGGAFLRPPGLMSIGHEVIPPRGRGTRETRTKTRTKNARKQIRTPSTSFILVLSEFDSSLTILPKLERKHKRE